MGTGTAEDAADEADLVMKLIGPKLMTFQHSATSPTSSTTTEFARPATTGSDLAKEWQRFSKSSAPVSPMRPSPARTPPSTTSGSRPSQSSSRARFDSSRERCYAERPAHRPISIDHPAPSAPQIPNSSANLKACSRPSKEKRPALPPHGNRFLLQGEQGVSNTYASALWGAEGDAKLGLQSSIGINFHGGGYGWYTPIAGTTKKGFEARPIYYGMLLFQQAAQATRSKQTKPTSPEPDDAIAAYSLKTNKG